MVWKLGEGKFSTGNAEKEKRRSAHSEKKEKKENRQKKTEKDGKKKKEKSGCTTQSLMRLRGCDLAW